MTLLILIFLVILIIDNSKLKKENIELRKKLGINTSLPLTNGSVSKIQKDSVTSNNSNTGVGQNNSCHATCSVNNSVKTVQQQQSNSGSLFLVGSILVVLASLLFLASSWDLLPGLIKTIILVCFQLFFTMMSNVCKEKYKLNKASNSFFCLAMAFVPIVLLSLSLFGVIGEFLSVHGDGFILYIGIVFALSDAFYKIVPTERLFIRKFGVVAEILAIFFVLLYFGVGYEVVLFVLSIYNILVFFLLHGGFVEKKDYFVIHTILLYFNLVNLLICICSEEIFGNIGLLLYAGFHFVKLSWKEEEKNTQGILVLGMACYAFGGEMLCDLVEVNYYFLYLLLLLPLFGLYFVFKDEKLKDMIPTWVGILASLFVLYSNGFFEKNYSWLLMYVLLSFIYVVSFVLGQKHVFKYLSYLGLYLVCVTFLCINSENDLIKYISLGIVLFMYGVEWFVPKLKDKNSKKVMMSVLILDSFVMMNSYSVLLPLVMMIVLVILEKEKEYYLLVPMLCGLTVFYVKEGMINNLLFLCTIATLSMVSIYRKKINIYSVVSLVGIFMSIQVIKYESFMLSLIFLVWGISHIVVNQKEKNTLYKLVSAISGLSLYINLLDIMEMEFVSVYSLGYYVTLILVTRFILEKNSFTEFLEYFLFIIIGFTSLFMMRGELDGLFEVFILFMISVVSHNKYKPYFRMSVVFIFIYVLMESAQFLIFIPWYVYVLGIGLAFIMLGAKEEKKKKKDNSMNNHVGGSQENIVISKEENVELPKMSNDNK